MPNFIDLSGQRFGRWTVIDRGETRYTVSGRPIVTWRCKCDCGTVKNVDSNSLRSGKTLSCGCYRVDNSRKMTLKRNKEKAKYDGDFDKRLYQTWYSMKSRCYDKTHKSFSQYGGRGIKVCKEWFDSYVSFRAWALANGYTKDLTIDRIDYNGDYCPENCRWATMKQQGNNRRTNHYIEANGERHTLTEWSELMNISFYKVQYYAERGYSGDAFYNKLLAGGGRG